MLKIKCPHCGYKWFCKSLKKWVCCPNCQRKFERKPSGVKK
jgi:uncharacterized Zn finger protein (UPF0148 family)